jgi:hypothetical protein
MVKDMLHFFKHHTPSLRRYNSEKSDVDLVPTHNAIVACTLLTPLYFIMGNSVYWDLPITVENMWQHIIDGCAAMNPHIID